MHGQASPPAWQAARAACGPFCCTWTQSPSFPSVPLSTDRCPKQMANILCLAFGGHWPRGEASSIPARDAVIPAQAEHPQLHPVAFHHQASPRSSPSVLSLQTRWGPAPGGCRHEQVLAGAPAGRCLPGCCSAGKPSSLTALSRHIPVCVRSPLGRALVSLLFKPVCKWMYKYYTRICRETHKKGN